MSEHSDEHGILADITSVAAFLSGSIGSFSKEVVGHIARELISADSLLPEKRSESEEQAEDGSVVKRFTCFEFDQYLGIGERIPVID